MEPKPPLPQPEPEPEPLRSRPRGADPEPSRGDDFVPSREARSRRGQAAPSATPEARHPVAAPAVPIPARPALHLRKNPLARFAGSIFVANLILLIATFTVGWQMYNAWDIPREVRHAKPSFENVMVISDLDQVDAEAMGQQGGPAAILQDKIVVAFKEEVPVSQIAEVGAQLGISFSTPYDGAPRVVTARIDPGRRAELLDRLNGHPGVRAAEPEIVYWPQWVPNDKGYSMQWNMQMIGMETAWEFTKGSNAVVAVVDTGVMIQRGLKSFVVEDLAQTASKPGYDFAYGDSEPEDFQGHGTHVAGTIAQSTDNAIGVSGVAPHCAIMPIKVFPNRGGAENSAVASGVRYAADKGANVINMSLGSPVFSQVLDDAVQYAYNRGVTIVVAAGNSGKSEVHYPAGCNHVIAVSAVDRNQNLTGYSTYGFHVEIAAPGGVTDIISQGGFFPRLDFLLDRYKDRQTGIIQGTVYVNRQMRTLEQGYRSFQGTSMASPHVAGVAALLYSLGVTNTLDIRTVLRTTAAKKDPPEKFGAGILDAAAAVRSVAKKGQLAGTKANVAVFIAIGAVGLLLLRKGGSGLIAGWLPEAIGLGLGLVLPDYLTKQFGLTSYANLLAHSVIVPAVVVLLLSDVPLVARFCSFLAVGVAVAIALAYQSKTSLLPVLDLQKTQLWLLANIVFGILILAHYISNRPRWRTQAAG